MSIITEVKLTQLSSLGTKREWHGAEALKCAGAPLPAGMISPTTRMLADIHRNVLLALRDELSGHTPEMNR
ncbi:MAG: hypothetical protein SFW65_07890 [Alphaproteobacteria bacterium]|nr:hypothetical protein [Alphaproteobacteria bacterium]